MTNYTDNQIENMKQILVEQFESYFTHEVAAQQDEVHNIEEGIYTYSVVGFEISAFMALEVCTGSGNYPQVVFDQVEVHVNIAYELEQELIEQGYDEGNAFDESRIILEDKYIDFDIRVNLVNNTIESTIALDYCVSVFKEDIDYQNFEDQCKRASEAL